MLEKLKQLFAQVDMTEGKPWEKIVEIGRASWRERLLSHE